MRAMLTAALIAWAGTAAAQGPKLGFKAPPGFEVSLYADDAFATDIFSLAIDAKGRVVVAGKNYVKILEDRDRDGKADHAILFSKLPASGAHGMCFDGPDLIAVGDKGIRRYHDDDGDGVCDRVSPAWFPFANDNEHAANGVVRGPDGWFYVVGGNDSGIDLRHVTTDRSPIKVPRAGAIARISPDGKNAEVVADGFRNPYDLAFGVRGEIFTVDSDGERVHRLPYYTPNRLFEAATGRHHGWVNAGWQSSWARPGYWPDTAPRLVEIGRGSPTGVHVYRHRAFPERYRGAVFSLCWTFGRVYCFPLERDGSTYRSKTEVFMETTGDVGFAPTDMAVGPEGDLFVAIGGRGTRGSVFRVRYTGKTPDAPTDPLERVLQADEPLSAWSRAAWVPVAKTLGRAPFDAVVADAKRSEAARIRAIEVLTELFGGVTPGAATSVLPPEVRARVLWSVARTQSAEQTATAALAAADATDPRVARAVWEALMTVPPNVAAAVRHADHGKPLASDRHAFEAALAVRTGPLVRSRLVPARDPTPDETVLLWRAATDPKRAAESDALVERASAQVELTRGLEQMLAIRTLQVALGDLMRDGDPKVRHGYAPERPVTLSPGVRSVAVARLANVFAKASDRPVRREIVRTAALLEANDEAFVSAIATSLARNAGADDDMHTLLALARMPGPRTADATQATATALLRFVIALQREHGARPADQVPAILEALTADLLRRDPKLAEALVAHPTFGHPGHELHALALPAELRARAADRLIQGASDAWSPELAKLVSLLGEPTATQRLRTKATDPNLRDFVALHLAKNPVAADAPVFVAGLDSAQAKVQTACAAALARLEHPGDATAAAAALRALRRVPASEKALHQQLATLLGAWTGQREKDVAGWTDAFVRRYGPAGEKLLGMAGAGAAAWNARLDQVDWASGDVARGAVVFAQRSCARCHGDQRRLGPDLAGAAQRFSLRDLFVAIVDPSKDIAPAYRPTAVVTRSDKTYSGMLIYQSQELTLLQTSADETVRLPGSEVAATLPGVVSFMPSGLLDSATDRDLADLAAYLKSLRK